MHVIKKSRDTLIVRSGERVTVFNNRGVAWECTVDSNGTPRWEVIDYWVEEQKKVIFSLLLSAGAKCERDGKGHRYDFSEIGVIGLDSIHRIRDAGPALLNACEDALKCIGSLLPFRIGTEDETAGAAIDAVEGRAEAVREKLRAAIVKAKGKAT